MAYLILDDVMRAYENAWRKEKEKVAISLDTTLSAALNKCPAEWIGAICTTIGIPWDVKKEKVRRIVKKLTDVISLEEVVQSLPDECRRALGLVLEKGGWVKYGQLSRRFGHEEGGFFWTRSPPRSVIGILRLHGLLFVGRSGLGGKTYKVAVLPKDLRLPLGGILGSTRPTHEHQSRLK